MAGYATSPYAGAPYAGEDVSTTGSGDATGTITGNFAEFGGSIAGGYTSPPLSGTLAGSFSQLTGSLEGNAFEPGLGGFLAGSFGPFEGEFFGDLLTSPSGLVLADRSTSTVAPPVEVLPEAVVQHIVTPTVPVPVLAGGRPQ